MNDMTHNGKRGHGTKIMRKLSVLLNEAVWQLALVAVVVAALVDGALTIGGGSIA